MAAGMGKFLGLRYAGGTSRGPSRFALFDSFGTSRSYFAYHTEGGGEVKHHFADIKSVAVVRGLLPNVIGTAELRNAGFVHVDLNRTASEEASLLAFEPMLLPGAVFFFDDSGNSGCAEQLEVARAFAVRHAAELPQLPTGQAPCVVE